MWNLCEAYLDGGYPSLAAGLFEAMERLEILNSDIVNRTANVFLDQGNCGNAIEMLYRSLEPKIDPLGPDNILFFMTGPLQGLPAPNVGRWALVTKSPLTGAFLDTHCGGPLGREIKNSGYDAVAVTGKSDVPITLVIEDDDGVTLLFVSHDTGAVKALCKRAIFLDKGNAIYKGGADVAEEKYFSMKVELEQAVVKSNPINQ